MQTPDTSPTQSPEPNNKILLKSPKSPATASVGLQMNNNKDSPARATDDNSSLPTPELSPLEHEQQYNEEKRVSSIQHTANLVNNNINPAQQSYNTRVQNYNRQSSTNNNVNNYTNTQQPITSVPMANGMYVMCANKSSVEQGHLVTGTFYPPVATSQDQQLLGSTTGTTQQQQQQQANINNTYYNTSIHQQYYPTKDYPNYDHPNGPADQTGAGNNITTKSDNNTYLGYSTSTSIIKNDNIINEKSDYNINDYKPSELVDETTYHHHHHQQTSYNTTNNNTSTSNLTHQPYNNNNNNNNINSASTNANSSAHHQHQHQHHHHQDEQQRSDVDSDVDAREFDKYLKFSNSGDGNNMIDSNHNYHCRNNSVNSNLTYNFQAQHTSVILPNTNNNNNNNAVKPEPMPIGHYPAEVTYHHHEIAQNGIIEKNDDDFSEILADVRKTCYSN